MSALWRIVCRIFGHDYGIGGAAYYDGQCFRCGKRSPWQPSPSEPSMRSDS